MRICLQEASIGKHQQHIHQNNISNMDTRTIEYQLSNIV